MIAILSWSVIGLTAIFTVHISRLNRRLDIQEAEIRQLRHSENQNALDICRIGDMASDTREEVTAHARVLDNHTDRLSVLEGER